MQQTKASTPRERPSPAERKVLTITGRAGAGPSLHREQVRGAEKLHGDDAAPCACWESHWVGTTRLPVHAGNHTGQGQHGSLCTLGVNCSNPRPTAHNTPTVLPSANNWSRSPHLIFNCSHVGCKQKLRVSHYRKVAPIIPGAWGSS